MQPSFYEKNSSSVVLDLPYLRHTAFTLPSAESDSIIEYVLTLQKLMAEKAAGMDPVVRIKTFSFLADESIPTLYRKQSLGTCPRPIKRGRSSLWKLSEVELYVSGNWKVSTNCDN